MKKTRVIGLFSALAGSIILTACVGTNPATGGSMLSFVSEEQEFRLGDQHIGGAIKDHGGLYTEKPELNDYLAKLLAETVAVSERADKPFELHLVSSDVVNAFALPGHIAFTRGILPYFNSEAELMHVMGHEVGHVTARHTAAQQTSAVLTNLGLLAAQIAVGQSTDSQAAVDATAQLGGFGAAIGMSTYSRHHEREADRLGLRYMTRLGYDPAGAANVFRTLDIYKELLSKILVTSGSDPLPKGGLTHLLASHPDSQERVELLEELKQETGITGGKINKIDYFQMIDGIAYGPMPMDGVWAKDYYHNAKFRFTYQLPADWFFPRQRGFYEAVHPESKTRLIIYAYKFKGVSKTAKEEMLNYVPGLRDRKTLNHPEFDIYTGIKIGASEPFGPKHYRRYVVVVNKLPMSEKAKDRFLLFVFDAPDEASLAAREGDMFNLINSLDALTKTEADDIQPLRVNLQAVKAGDTAASLAAQMPMRAFHEEWFRLLNGLEPGTDVVDGQLIKMIVDPNQI